MAGNRRADDEVYSDIQDVGDQTGDANTKAKLKIECDVRDGKGRALPFLSQPLSITLPPTSLIGSLRRELSTYLETTSRQLALVHRKHVLRPSEFDMKPIRQLQLETYVSRLTAYVLEPGLDAERIELDAHDIPVGASSSSNSSPSRSLRKALDDKQSVDFSLLSASVLSNAELSAAMQKVKRLEKELAEVKQENAKLSEKTRDQERQLEESRGSPAVLAGLSTQKLRELDITLREAGARVSKRLLEDSVRERQCIVCQEKDRQVIFDSCAHCVACESCAKQIMEHDKSCPVDRKPILSYKRFYM